MLADARPCQGALDHLRDVREAVALPVLRKDFMFHPYQLYEARVAGADAVLLIAAVLSDTELRELSALARKLGMAALIEGYSEEELARVLPLNPDLIGVNNRDLQTFEVDFDNTARLRTLIPPEIAVAGERGIKSPDDVRAMRVAGGDAGLVG